MRKFTHPALLGMLGALSAAGSAPVLAVAGCSARSAAIITPLVELYTSEGCSSCPPADRWLSRTYAIKDANFLAFHVDYWDGLGWPDRFASSRYSQRQRNRVNAAGERTVYTPQVMVGAQIQAPWRSDTSFAQTLASERRPADAQLALMLDPTASGYALTLEASALSADDSGAVQVWLAHYVDGVVSDVRAGENDGNTLRHDRVVTQMWGPWRLSETGLVQTLELDLAYRRGGFTAFAQDAGGRIWQSLSLLMNDCVAAR